MWPLKKHEIVLDRTHVKVHMDRTIPAGMDIIEVEVEATGSQDEVQLKALRLIRELQKNR